MVLFDGPHTYPRVASYGFLVGAMFGGGAVMALMWSEHWELGAFIATVGVFHELEYLQTATFNPSRLSLDSFLLNHSNEYQFAMLAGLVEYLLTLWLFPGLKSLTFIKLIGLLLMVSGETLRATAMYTAKASFNHIVQSQRSEEHVLVTHGVYSYCRHPAYAGFFWYSIGTQVLLCNPLCTAAFAWATWMFFNDRIPDEERHLVSFFGADYLGYRARVPTLIPYIK